MRVVDGSQSEKEAVNYGSSDIEYSTLPPTDRATICGGPIRYLLYNKMRILRAATKFTGECLGMKQVGPLRTL